MTEPPDAMKQVYTYAVSRGAYSNANTHQLHSTEEPPAMWNSKILRPKSIKIMLH